MIMIINQADSRHRENKKSSSRLMMIALKLRYSRYLSLIIQMLDDSSAIGSRSLSGTHTVSFYWNCYGYRFISSNRGSRSGNFVLRNYPLINY